MRKKENSRKSIFTLLIILVIIFCIFKFFVFKKTYTLEFKDTQGVIKIVSEKNNSKGKLELISKDIVDQVIAIMQPAERETKIESITDQPSVETYYIITLKDSEEKIYIYAKDNKYYIEQPYNGIYEITEDEYNKLMGYLSF